MKTAILKLFLAALFLFIVSFAFAQAGTLDSSFGVNGKVIPSFPPNAVTINNGGKIIIGADSMYWSGSGYNSDFVVIQYQNNGKLDSSFGINGKIKTHFDSYGTSSYSVLRSMVIQNDGKIIVAGEDFYHGYFNLSRYQANGKPDSTFGVNGKVSTLISNVAEISLSKVILLADGSILAGGTVDGFCMVKYKSNGTLDSSFGNNGKIIKLIDLRYVVDIGYLSNGKIIVGIERRGATEDKSFEIDCLLPNGNIDSTFGTNGSVFANFYGHSNLIQSISILSNNQILAGGSVTNDNNEQEIGIVRYNSKGVMDSTFGLDGISTTRTDGNFSKGKLLIQTDNKIIYASNFLMRLMADGKEDTAFGNNGVIQTGMGFGDATLQSDEKIVVISSSSIARFKNDAPITVSLAKNITVTEGNAGTTTPATFTVTLNKATTKQVKVNYHTRNLSAKSGSDYVAKTGTITFGIGVTSKTVTVNVKGDNTVEANERFAFVITDPTNAVLGLDSVICIIKNDDPSFTSITNVDAIKTSSIKIYPNPVKDVLTIDGLKSNTIISIINEDGKILSVNNTTSSLFTQNIKQLSPGTYFVKIESENKTETLRFIKQ